VFFLFNYWGQWDIVLFIKRLLAICLTVDKSPFLGATWFLPALFWVSVSIHIINTLFRKWHIPKIFLLLPGIAVAMVGMHITFPCYISRNMILFLFYILGGLYAYYLKNKIWESAKTVIAILMFAISVILHNYYAGSIARNIYDSKPAFLVIALFSSLFWIWVAKMLDKIPQNRIIDHLAYLGKNSIYIVLWQFIAFKVVILIQIAVYKADIAALMSHPVYDSTGLWFLMYLAAGIYLGLLIGKGADKIMLKRVKKI
jgi:hypothetical protein